MEGTRAHRITLVDPGSRGAKTRRTRLHLQRAVILLAVLAVQPQGASAAGTFELQIRHFQNPHGFLQTGDCCDLQAGGGQRCSARDQCDTFFQACLKEYQARVVPTGACTFGSGTTGVLGGNSHSLRHRGHNAGGGGGREDGSDGHIAIPFKYAWPVSTGGGRMCLLPLWLPREQAKL
uniref:Notch ligand N-terminal domain-containing protein n=1 Tax=Fundulus heteroclitus TaxID=8078 RepID=A0A3Q2P006_FUNHE